MSTIPDPTPDPTPGPTPDHRPITSRRARRTKAWLAAAGVATGLTLGSAGIAAAATNGSSTSTSTAAANSGSRAGTAPASSGSDATAPTGRAPGGDPATAGHGPGETLLTGTTATKAKAAAEEAEPGATVIRAETDAQGATYEVHMKKADGSDVTVKLDANFKVTATDTGFA